jgi:hypothetical protein
LGKVATQLFLALGNTPNTGAVVTGSFWAVRESNPMPLVSSLLAPFSEDPTGLQFHVQAADTLPFTGELTGRFLSLHDNVVRATASFASTPPGDWWVADCGTSEAAFTLGIDEPGSVALLMPRNWISATALAADILGLWIAKGEGQHTGGAV